MTKGGSLPRGAGGHHRADGHLRIGDADPLNEQCHPWSALGKRPLVQRGLDTLAKTLDSLGPRRDIDVLLRLGIALPQVLRSTMWRLRPLLASPLALLALDHLRQGEIEEPSLVAFELRQHITQCLTTRVQGLGPPCPPLGPCEFIGAEGRLPPDTAASLPPQLVQSLRGSIACRAALAEGAPERLGTASTAVIRVAGGQRAPTTRAPTPATTASAAQYILRGGIGPAGHWHVTLQAALGRCEGFLAEDGRYRHGQPRLCWGRLLTLAGAHRR